jgi:hypothetical protein
VQCRSSGDRRRALRTIRTARDVRHPAPPPVAQRHGLDRARADQRLPLVRHNVFFSDDYPAEFKALAAGRLADAPSVYVCAQDRDAGAGDITTPRTAASAFRSSSTRPHRATGTASLKRRSRHAHSGWWSAFRGRDFRSIWRPRRC